jgi:hypothetical protein
MVSTEKHTAFTIGRHGEMIIGTHAYEDFFLLGHHFPEAGTTTMYPSGMGGERINDNDYSTYLATKDFRKLPWVKQKYGRSQDLCYLDLDRHDRGVVHEMAAEIRRRDPCPLKFRDIELQQDWYEHTGVFETKDPERVKKIIGQVRQKTDYMKDYCRKRRERLLREREQ